MAVAFAGCVAVPPDSGGTSPTNDLPDASSPSGDARDDEDGGGGSERDAANSSSRDATTESDDGTSKRDAGPGDVVTEVEPNDEPADATPVALGENFAGTVDEGSEDWWRVVIPDAPTILELKIVSFHRPESPEVSSDTIEFSVSPADETMGERVLITDDGLMRRFFISQPGEYLIGVNSDGDTPVYEVAVRERRLPSTEAPTSEVPGDLNDQWPDIYQYMRDLEALVRVTMKASPDSPEFHPYLIVQEPNGDMIAHTSSDGSDNEIWVEFDAEQNTPIWIVATGWNMPVDSDYNLRFTVTE